MKKILSKTFAAVAAALAIASLAAMPTGAAWTPAHHCGGRGVALTTANSAAAPTYTCPHGTNCPYGNTCYSLGHYQRHHTGRRGQGHCHR